MAAAAAVAADVEAPAAVAASAEGEAKAPVEVEQLTAAIAALVPQWDMSGSLRDFRLRLEKDFGLETGALEGMKDKIAELLMEQMQQDASAEGEAEAPAEVVPRASRKRRSGASWMHRGKRRRAAKPAAQDLRPEDISVSVAGKPIDLSIRDSASGTRGFFACQEVPLLTAANGKRYALQCLVQCVAVEVFDGPEAEVEEAEDQDQDQDQNGEQDRNDEQGDGEGQEEENAEVEAERDADQDQDQEQNQAAEEAEQTPDLN